MVNVYSLNKTQNMVIEPNSIVIKDTKRQKVAMPYGVISILPNFQVRLGTSIDVVIAAIKKAQLNIMMQPIQLQNLVGYKIISIGISEEYTLEVGTLLTSKKRIIGYQFNDLTIAGFKAPRGRFSIIQLMRVGQLSHSEETVHLVTSLLKGITGNTKAHEWRITILPKSIVGITKSSDDEPNVHYLFSADSNNKLYLKSVGYASDGIKKLALREG